MQCALQRPVEGTFLGGLGAWLEHTVHPNPLPAEQSLVSTAYSSPLVVKLCGGPVLPRVGLRIGGKEKYLQGFPAADE